MSRYVYNYVNPAIFNTVTHSGEESVLGKNIVWDRVRINFLSVLSKFNVKPIAIKPVRFILIEDLPESYYAAWSSDGQFITIACFDNTIRIYDAGNKSEISELYFEREGYNVSIIGWSPDGKYIAVALNGYDDIIAEHYGVIQLFETQGYTVTKTIISGSVTNICWSPDSRFIAYSSYHTDYGEIDRQGAYIYDIEIGLLRNKWENQEQAPLISWTKDIDKIVLVEGQYAKVYELNSNRVLGIIDMFFDRETGYSKETVYRVVCNPIYPLIAVLSGNYIQVWNTKTKILVHNILLEDEIFDVFWNANGIILSTTGGKTLCMWDAFSGDLVWSIVTREGFNAGMSWSPTSNKVIAISNNLPQIWLFDIVKMHVIQDEAAKKMIRINEQIINMANVNFFIVDEDSVTIVFEAYQIQVTKSEADIIRKWLQDHSVDLYEWYEKKYVDRLSTKSQKINDESDDIPF